MVGTASKTGVSRLQQGAVLDGTGSLSWDPRSVVDGAYPLIHANARTETSTWCTTHALLILYWEASLLSRFRD